MDDGSGNGKNFAKINSRCESLQDWSNWCWQYQHRIKDANELSKWVSLTVEEKRAINLSHQTFPMAITPYFASRLDPEDPKCPLRQQAIPSIHEFKVSVGEMKDPCGEEKDTVVPGLVHRYPDRVLLLLTDACAVYCRHCTRRRLVGAKETMLTNSELQRVYDYIDGHKNIRDVLISGGDPFLVSDSKLESVLKNLRSIKHVEILRIGTRLPVTLPQRFTTELLDMLRKYHPLYISIHFNHPKELSEETKAVCNKLADSGIPLGSQTVLLKGINDSPEIMKQLFHELLKIRVRPYYLYQCDPAVGTEHFRTTIQCGLKIISSLRGFTTGYAIPTYVIDAPGGGGKIPINPDYVISYSKRGVILRNYENKIYVYPLRATGEAEVEDKEVKLKKEAKNKRFASGEVLQNI